MLLERVLACKNPLLLSASVIGAANFLGFTATALTHTHKLTDLTGTGAFVLSVWTTYGVMRYQHGKSLPLRKMLLAVGVSMWGVRLGGFLFSRILNSPEDNRLSEFFPKRAGELPIKLAGFWSIQACWAFFTLLPVTMEHCLPAVKARPSSATLRAAGTAGWALFAAGLLCEALADYQKSAFKALPGNSAAFCNVGVWHYSRHPNYFGELLVWWGLWLVAAPHVPKWTLVSPMWVSLLILGISGVPILEKKYDAKFVAGHPLAKEYADYKATTSLLVPLPKF